MCALTPSVNEALTTSVVNTHIATSKKEKNRMHPRYRLPLMFALLASTLAFGADKSHKKAQKVLSDKQLDSITAGTDTGSNSLSGTIVAGSATATQSTKGDVSLSDGAEAETKALNLVNAADSAVGNGVNVWDGELKDQSAATVLKVDQNNLVTQNGSRSPAVLGSYARNANDTLNKTENKTWDKSTTESTSDSTTHLDTTSSMDAITSNSTVDTKSEILGASLQGGKGIAGTGKLNVALDGGKADFKLTGDAASVLSGEIDLNLVLPKIGVNFDGSLCVVNGGSCTAAGTEQRSDSTKLEDSSSDTKSASSKDNETVNSDIHHVVQGGVEVDGASGSAIVLDGSTFSNTQSYSVSLSGTTQQNARAMNLVNAAGSLVGNGVNVSRTPTVGPSLHLDQDNTVLQDAAATSSDDSEGAQVSTLPLGGSIVADGSQMTDNHDGHVSLAGSAEANAESLNLVNAADSSIANGVNVWGGQLAGQNAATKLNVDQSNVVVQNEQRTASLPSYVRGENSDVHTTFVGSDNSATQSTFAHNIDHLNTTDVGRDLSTSGNVDTKSTIAGQSFQGGSGFSGSGDVNFSLDAGSVHFGASANLAGVLSGGLSVDVTLPTLTADFHGSICAVMMGSCASSGSVTDTSSTTKKDTDSTDKSSSSSDTGSSNLRVASTIFAPLEINDARAENVVVDGSTLSSTKDYSVALSGTTQQNASALNLINASGSLLANAVNVSRTPTVGPNLTLSQVNFVRQTH